MHHILSVDESADLLALYHASQTCEGAGLMSVDTLEALANFAAERSAWLVILECYRLEGDWQVPCVELGINYPMYEEICANSSSSEKKTEVMLSVLSVVLADVRKTQQSHVFDVWFEVAD